ILLIYSLTTLKLGENILSMLGCTYICTKEHKEKECCPGYWGPECYECPGGSENICNQHGICLDGIGKNGTCICNANYGGFACQRCKDENHFGPDCQSVCECQNGICNHGPSGDGKCKCYPGYAGPKCDQEVRDCGGVICEANSLCVVKNGKAECDCMPGYRKTGIHCIAPDPCHFFPCSPYAVCKTFNVTKYQCTCAEGYQGNGRICQVRQPCLDNNGGCPINTTICVTRSRGKVNGALQCTLIVAVMYESRQLAISCICQKGEIEVGRSCYKTILSEIFNEIKNVIQMHCIQSNAFLFWYLLSMKVSYAQEFCRKHIIAGQHLLKNMNKDFWTLSGHKVEVYGQFLDMPPLLILIHLFLQKTIAEILASMEIASRFETILEVTLSTIEEIFFVFLLQKQLSQHFDRVYLAQIYFKGFWQCSEQMLFIFLLQGRILLGNSKVPINKRDILASNGIIHTLDGILIPPSILPILPKKCIEENYKVVKVNQGCLTNLFFLLYKFFPYKTISNECVYTHDPLGLNVLKKGCRRYCTVKEKPGCCKGFFGLSCTPCPGGYSNPCYNRGSCNDGIHGNGQCNCYDGFKGIACHICSNPNKHGENCTEDCSCIHGICDNRPGSKGVCQTGTCKDGYTGEFCDVHSHTCESAGSTLNCHVHATCTVNDTVNCVCLDGYEGNGFSCKPIDACSKPGRGGCSDNATCTSTGPGRVSCQCIRGWTGDGKACVAIDNCVTETRGGCHINADCNYIGPGQSSCMCKKGYEGDGYVCDKIDPCMMDNGGCHELAVCEILNTGEKNCRCSDGYIGDGIQCYGDVMKVKRCISILFQVGKSHFSMPRGANITVLVPQKEAVQNLSKDEKEFWLESNMLPSLVRSHILQGSFTTQQLKKYIGQELPTLNPEAKWEIKKNNEVISIPPAVTLLILILVSDYLVLCGFQDNDTMQYHVVLGDKLFLKDLKNGVHRSTMLGFSNWLMFSNRLNKVRMSYKLYFYSVWFNKEHLKYQKLYFSNSKFGCYYGVMCEMCPGKPGNWCSGNGVCQDGIEGNGDCQCQEGFHGTACEMCQAGRYGPKCQSECNCNKGQCNDGLLGDGSCTCNSGFKGVNCDQGKLGNKDCMNDSTTSQPTCSCSAGYSGNGTSCTGIAGKCFQFIIHPTLFFFGNSEIDPCAEDNGSCSMYANCTKIAPGKNICTCKEGYSGDGTLCRGKHHFSEWEKAGCIKDLLRYHIVICQKLLSDDLESQDSLTALSGHKIRVSMKEVCVIVSVLFHFHLKGLLNLVNNTLHQPFTMLWPTDGAFNSLPAEMQKWLYHKDHRSKLSAYLRGHMVLASKLTELSSLRTLQGSTISFSCSKTNAGDIVVDNGNARIVQRYMEFNVGIAYGIDHLLELPNLGSHCDQLQMTCYYEYEPFEFSRRHHWRQYPRVPFAQNRPRKPSRRGCKKTCLTTKWVPQCCANHYGKNCQVCPGGLEAPCQNRGTCDDGFKGSGQCNCSAAFVGVACELCAPGYYGADCTKCSCSGNGICNEGLLGDGFCFCSVGWTGEHCETKLAAVPQCSPACHPNAVCRANNICECNLYYEGDGKSCTVIDQCGSNNGGCSNHAKCTQNGTDVFCTCLVDYQGDGYICNPIDICADGRNGHCSEHAICITTGPNTRRCECKAGYVGNGLQCFKEVIPPTDRCLEENGQCHVEAICTDLHFEDKTVGVFHLQSPSGKYNFTYEEAEASCAAEGATLATLQQLSAAQQMGFHLCIVGWLFNHTAGYPTVYPSQNCGTHHVGIVNYGYRNNVSEKWDAYCYQIQDVQCNCKDGYIGDGYSCTGSLLDVLAQQANFSVFYSIILDFANTTQEGVDFLNFLSEDLAYKTLFVPLNSGFGDNTVRITKMDTGGVALIRRENNFNKLSQANIGDICGKLYELHTDKLSAFDWTLFSSKDISCSVAGNSGSFKANAEEVNE
uniref:Stabilin 1 n=1 Tax=Pseudonaja textilis TaxID=8673 RepID=A0A670YC37_PSETE